MNHCIGLDISKASINVHIPKNSLDLVISNDDKSLKALMSKLKKIYKKEVENLIFIFEPTGSYSEGLRKFCSKQEIKCFIINPKQFSNYAKALGHEIKNDEEDAKVLSKAIVLAKKEQITIPYYDETVEAIKELMSYYKFTVKQSNQLSNHLEALQSKKGNSFAIKEITKSIKSSKNKEKEIIIQVQAVINENPKHKRAYENISTMVGIGQISAIALLHLFLKYPDANQRQLTSLAGLNPVYKQSGTSIQSSSKISKSGSKLYRGSLFMGVMTAIRFDEKQKAFFERLRVNGKHTTQAQIAVMRKMILIAHSLYKNDTQYDKNYGTSKVENMA